MLGADLAQLLQVALRRNKYAGGTCNRLDDDGCDGGGVMQRDDALQFGGKIAAMFRLTAGEGVLARQMRMRHVVDAGQERAEHLAVGDDAADGNAAEVHA